MEAQVPRQDCYQVTGTSVHYRTSNQANLKMSWTRCLKDWCTKVGTQSIKSVREVRHRNTTRVAVIWHRVRGIDLRLKITMKASLSWEIASAKKLVVIEVQASSKENHHLKPCQWAWAQGHKASWKHRSSPLRDFNGHHLLVPHTERMSQNCLRSMAQRSKLTDTNQAKKPLSWKLVRFTRAHDPPRWPLLSWTTIKTTSITTVTLLPIKIAPLRSEKSIS